MAKALVAFGIAFFGALGTAAIDNEISSGELFTAIGAGLAALGVVWAVPNKTQA